MNDWNALLVPNSTLVVHHGRRFCSDLGDASVTPEQRPEQPGQSGSAQVRGCVGKLLRSLLSSSIP